VRFAFIDAEKTRFPVEVLCGILGVSRSGFYAWKKRPESAHARVDRQLTVHIRAAHLASHRTYGSPRVHDEIRARGLHVGEKRVARLMREHGIRPRQKRRFRKTTDSKHQQPIAPNLLARAFDPPAPNAAWVTDVTYVWTTEGWLYLAVILDLFSRRVVGWSTSDSNDRALALAALDRALQLRRPGPGLIHHSDRGSPYASDDYRAVLEGKKVIASMSRTGDCWDNAVAESFFATLKAELVDHESYVSRSKATDSIGDYIDNFYNPVRRHSTLGSISPIEFELKSQVAALAA
jgi:transposase InsO family protein